MGCHCFWRRCWRCCYCRLIPVPATEIQLRRVSRSPSSPPRPACLQWHLTGIELESEEDPASEEHFGISVAEGGWVWVSVAAVEKELLRGWPQQGALGHQRRRWCALSARATFWCPSGATPLLPASGPSLPLVPLPRTAGMSAGVIPVVLQRGGVGDIVRNGSTGYLALGAPEVAVLTRHVYVLDAATREQLRR